MGFRNRIVRVSQLIADKIAVSDGTRTVTIDPAQFSGDPRGGTNATIVFTPGGGRIAGSASDIALTSPVAGGNFAVLDLSVNTVAPSHPTTALVQADSVKLADNAGDVLTLGAGVLAFTGKIRGYPLYLGDDIRTVGSSSQASGVPGNQGTLTVALVAGNRYRATWIGNMTPGTAGQYFNLDLKHGIGSSTAGTVFQRTFWDCRAVGRTVTATVVGEFIAPTTQNENIVAVMTPQGGTGATYTDGTAGAPASVFYVEEIQS